MKRWDTTFYGLREMFQGNSGDIPQCRWGHEWRVQNAQTKERVAPSALAEIQYLPEIPKA